MWPRLTDPKHMFVVSTGPMTEPEVKSLVDVTLFDGSKAPAYEPMKFQSIDLTAFQSTKREVTLIHRAGATDNQVLMVFPRATSCDLVPQVRALVTHQIFGGGLSGRLGNTLRTGRGLSYHVSSFVPGGALPFWAVYTHRYLQPCVTLLPAAVRIHVGPVSATL
jgi:predicted Zn-dependent peptidase